MHFCVSQAKRRGGGTLDFGLYPATLKPKVYQLTGFFITVFSIFR